MRSSGEVPALKFALLCLVAVTSLTSACHEVRPGDVPDTDIEVRDASGEPMLGQVRFQPITGQGTDGCDINAARCGVALPTGEYRLTFHKMSAGFTGSSIGGAVSGGRASGCFQAEVKLVQGETIICKQKGLIGCGTAIDNLDCGKASSERAVAAPLAK